MPRFKVPSIPQKHGELLRYHTLTMFEVGQICRVLPHFLHGHLAAPYRKLVNWSGASWSKQDIFHMLHNRKYQNHITITTSSRSPTGKATSKSWWSLHRVLPMEGSLQGQGDAIEVWWIRVWFIWSVLRIFGGLGICSRLPTLEDDLTI